MNRVIPMKDSLSFIDNIDNHKHGLFGEIEWGIGRYIKHFTTPNGTPGYRSAFKKTIDKDTNIIPIGAYQYTFDKLFNIALDENTTLRVGDLNDEAPQMKIGVPRQSYASQHYNFEVNGAMDSNGFVLNNQVGNINTSPNAGINISAMNFIFGFMVGDGGTKSDDKKPIAPNYKDRGLYRAVPFRMNNDGFTIPDNTYYGKSSVTSGSDIITSYYIKKFDNPAPHIVHCWVTDNPNELEIVDDTVFSSTSSIAIESYVEMNISISAEDCRGFFTSTDTTGRVNEVALVSGWYNNSQDDYEQLRIFSHYTRPDITLVEGDSIEAIYRLYAR